MDRDRLYSVYVDGFDPVLFVAKSASAARYAAFKAYREAGYGDRWDSRGAFREFLRRVTQTLHLGPVPPPNTGAAGAR